MNFARTLKHAFKPPLDAGEFDELLKKIDANDRTAQRVIRKADEMDSKLCLECGPNRAKLRQLKVRRGAVQAHA